MNTYTFHVSLPGYGRVWRKVELPATATLADLHNSIQFAYDFGNDHLYSFFMSGKAWDSKSEYCLPEDADPWDFFDSDVDLDDEDLDDDLEDDDELSVEGMELAQSLLGLPEPPELSEDEELEMPTVDQARSMFAELQNNPEARELFLQGMATQLGLPPAMAQMIVGNLENVFGNMSDQDLEKILNMNENMFGAGAMGDPFGNDAAGDVRTTTLASLNLHKGQKFLYLFDYGDEWRFNVKVDAINQDADPSLEYPRLVEEVGKAPVQYEGWDEDDEEWDEDE